MPIKQALEYYKLVFNILRAT